MWRLAIAIRFLPGLAMVDTLTLRTVPDARLWALGDARCLDVIALERGAFCPENPDSDSLQFP